jgi:Na+/melibiose symporter-like transporter
MGLAKGLIPIAVAVIVFFVAYFVAYSPYRALYPDLLPDEIEGRAQSAQAVARGLGTMVALGIGGVLLAAAQIAPFAAAAGLLLICITAFSMLLLRRAGVPDRGRTPSVSAGKAAAEIRRLLAQRPELRAFLIANLLWELTLAAIKTFVVLWLTVGLHHSLSLASGVIGATAVLILVAAALSGRLADRYGRLRVMRIALWCWGAGMLVPIAVSSPPILAAAVPLVAIGGGVTMALPYALLIPMMPAQEHGAVTGLYGISRGLGIMLGPLLAGGAVQLAGGLLPENNGYGGMWFVAAAAAFSSLLALRRVQQVRR